MEDSAIQASRLSAALAGRYHIEREVGQGGMATVYLAEDVRHKRKVALKVLKPELAAVLGAERFVQEITTTAALQHPHILPLFDSGTADGFLYYVMPFIAGETLRTKLDRETQLGIAEAVKITTDVADALHYAHQQGVVHRDIKPENILLHNGRPVVADFGIALAVSAAAGGRMTETGLSLGTPHYMSPEQATAEKEITARSDVYSLGSVLYEMLTGSPPHTGASAQQIIMKIVTEDAAPVTKVRKAVPPHVAAAVSVALEKLPADRFASAADFASALASPGFTSARAIHGPAAASGARDWIRDPRTIGTIATAGLAVVALALVTVRPSVPPGPSEYDVGLPDSAAITRTMGIGFAVAPGGDFLIYQVAQGGAGELWYRSLRDGTTRRLEGTAGAWQPAISPDGSRVAFLRRRGEDWTVETVGIEGGSATSLGQGSGDGYLSWLADGRIQLVDGDGTRARWFDPGGGSTTSLGLRYCIMPAPLPDATAVVCGGGGNKRATRLSLRDGASHAELWTNAGDSTPVFGSHFQIVGGRYLTYLSIGGDLVAAPVDLTTGRVGRSVRMATGLGRHDYFGTGTYAISASGTLVYSHGINRAVGHLVRARDGAIDTLPVGRAAFLRFSFSPDGRRLAAVVESLEGEELRVYDLRTGRYVPWIRRAEVRQPVWSPRGDRLLFTVDDSVFVGSPDLAGPPEFVLRSTEAFEAFAWTPENKVVGVLWIPFLAVALHVGERPVRLDTLRSDVSFIRPSPDGRWIAYSNAAINEIWLERFPRDGQRYQVATGSIDEAHWLSSSELAFTTYDDGAKVERLVVNPSSNPPFGERRQWLDLPEFRGTAGLSTALSNGGIVYIQGEPAQPVRYLRVVPRWVDRMKHAVDAANR
ncbi:MAG: protein kinase domain-containing protein [Gemmatimonadaceae bacterium]